ncbi:hypothetical protein [Fodinibius sp.]|uniref:hypothetical protein n=1 Tax=Fodinibius sp. TaxID=1872440 RepID=UPI002ACE3DCE|nr:hypothetical protein [Fodinibius sp.]MDZ7658049.1 hypothetical protein [Fodinibius sp.]
MVHWSWLITAFIAGMVVYGMLSLVSELRDRRQVAQLYREEHLKRNQSVDVSADDFTQELELHKN